MHELEFKHFPNHGKRLVTSQKFLVEDNILAILSTITLNQGNQSISFLTCHWNSLFQDICCSNMQTKQKSEGILVAMILNLFCMA